MALFQKKQNESWPADALPRHVAIIMDGNGRWAKKRGLPRKAGHSAGAKAFRKIARYANQIGIAYMTVYAFSTENWKRPVEEVEAIMNLLRDYLKDAGNYKEENIKVHFIGDRSALADDIVALMEDAERNSVNATGMVLNIAVNYGGRNELVQAVRAIARRTLDGDLHPETITEKTIADCLYTQGQPDPDLVIRPSGEYRLSNFLIWQSAYAEFWFSHVLWPDFTEKHLNQALSEYIHRSRRFGGI